MDASMRIQKAIQLDTCWISSTGIWTETDFDGLFYGLLEGDLDGLFGGDSRGDNQPSLLVKALSVFKIPSFVFGGFLIENPSRIQEYVLCFRQFACFWNISYQAYRS